jgi:hypothetical protein
MNIKPKAIAVVMNSLLDSMTNVVGSCLSPQIWSLSTGDSSSQEQLYSQGFFVPRNTLDAQT